MTRVADNIIAKLARQLNDIFRRVLSGGLDAAKVFRVFKELLGTFLIKVDSTRSWDNMVKAGEYAELMIDPDFDPEVNLPTSRVSTGTIEVTFRQQPKDTAVGKWLDIISSNQSSANQFAHPFVALGIGEHHPYEQTESTIYTFWFDSSGTFWSMVLHDMDDGNARYLCIRPYSLETKLAPGCRVTVSTNQPVQSPDA